MNLLKDVVFSAEIAVAAVCINSYCHSPEYFEGMRYKNLD